MQQPWMYAHVTLCTRPNAGISSTLRAGISYLLVFTCRDGDEINSGG